MSVMSQIDQLKPGQHFIGVSEGLRGHFVVVYWINPEMGGFVEPYDSYTMSYATRDEAVEMARIVASEESLPLFV